MIRTHEGHARCERRGAWRVGWVARRRDRGGVVFIDRDASGVVQVVWRGAPWLMIQAEFCG
jgi:aspartyl-tRNA synthetase